MKNYIIASEKVWHENVCEYLQNDIVANWIRIKEKSSLTRENIEQINPEYIFFLHWSYIIPKEIYNNFRCVVFHITDLPYGRGGSPLQNLIVRGHTDTKISAIKVQNGIDTGDVYLKKDLSLEGTAREIFERATPIMIDMIKEIITNDLQPQPQKGNIVCFNRRKPQDGNISILNELQQVYDYIRMLDCDGYPSAFFETEYFRIEFTNASLNNEYITANVRIIKK
jgi:methionyl-tRNA formyltransferase